MVCPNCQSWAARSHAQLQNRLANMVDVPEARPFPCPECSSTDWATTRAFIRELSTPEDRRALWPLWFILFVSAGLWLWLAWLIMSWIGADE